MANDNIQPTNSQFLLYQDEDGVINVNVRFDDNDVWLSQQQIAMLFDTTRENVVQHIRNIFNESELMEERTCKKFLQVQTEGNRSVRRNIPHYNLDMIIAVGYLSPVAVIPGNNGCRFLLTVRRSIVNPFWIYSCNLWVAHCLKRVATWD